MEENKNTPTEKVEVPKQSFGKWLDNFWYHYKWHTIAVIFVIVVAIVCTVQLVGREDYDVLIAYAGSKDVSKKGEDGDVAEVVILETSLKDVVPDVDGNGEISVSLETFFWLSSAEIEALEAELAEKREEGGVVEEINYGLLTSNYQTVDSLILYSDYFLWFVSDDLYEYVKNASDDSRFVDLGSMPDGDSTAEFYGEDTCAVYLKSTEFYKMPGICDLPEDTLIVVRRLGVGTNKATKKAYEVALDMAKEIINYEY